MMKGILSGVAAFVVLCIAAAAAYLYFDNQQLRDAAASQTAAGGANTSTLPVAQAAVSPPSADSALFDMYGIVAKNSAVMVKQNSRAQVWFSQSFEEGTQRYHAVFFAVQQLNNKGELENDSHAASVPISVVTYKLSDGKWNPTFKQAAFAEFGSWGEPPIIKQAGLLKLGDRTALLVESSYSGQGSTEKGQSVLALEKDGWRDLGFVHTGGDNSGACDSNAEEAKKSGMQLCFDYKGKITSGLQSPNAQYPDLVVVHSGTRSDDNGKVIPATNKSVKYLNNTYQKK